MDNLLVQAMPEAQASLKMTFEAGPVEGVEFYPGSHKRLPSIPLRNASLPDSSNKGSKTSVTVVTEFADPEGTLI